MTGSIFYAHSGGVTSTINATAVSFIQQAKRTGIQKIWIGEYGLNGLLHDRLIAAHDLSDETLTKISNSPGSAFGSCRIKLPEYNESNDTFKLISKKLHDIGCDAFFYNGGNDSQDTCAKLASYFSETQNSTRVIGIPKTIDNDLFGTYCCPGYGSAAKYTATSILQTALDLRAMSHDSTKLFVLEVMGRDTGWIAAASALAKIKFEDIPLLIIMPEASLSMMQIQEKIAITIKENGFCIVCVAEGAVELPKHTADEKDAFGHTKHHGAGSYITSVMRAHGFKSHYAVSGYLQRSSSYLNSHQDLILSRGVGHAAIDLLDADKHGQMVTIGYNRDDMEWFYKSTPCANAANTARTLPDDFISNDKFGVSSKAMAYLRTCVQNNAHDIGLPDYHCDRLTTLMETV